MMKKTHKCARCKQEAKNLKSCVSRNVQYCNSECQKADWKLHSPHCPPFVVRDSPNKGKGLFATRNLKVGSLILLEDPLLVFVDDQGFGRHNKVLSAIQKLSKSDFEKVLTLHCPDDSDMESDVVTAAKIVGVNCIMVSPQDNQESALYYYISRLNHSCAPNAAWSWKKGNIRQKEVRAIMSITAGEEIFVSYTERFNTFDNRNKRKEELQMKWGFECFCQVCSLTGTEQLYNDQIRAEIQSNDSDILHYSGIGNLQKAVGCALKEVELMRKMEREFCIPIISALMECYELLCAAKFLRIPIHPKRLGVKLERDADVYRNEALELVQKIKLDFLMKNYKDKIAKINTKYMK